MANHNQHGRHVSGPAAPSWRSRDQAPSRDDREDGQGQSGYAAGRLVDDPAMTRGHNLDPGYDPRGDARPRRDQAPGTDERFAGRGGPGAREDRGYQVVRNTAHGGYGGCADGPEQPGYQSGYNQQGFGEGDDAASDGYRRSMGPRGYGGFDAGPGHGPGDPGYGPRDANTSHYGQTSQGLGRAGYGGGDQGSLDYRRMRPGEHRGKGPRGFQRSDERVRDLVCEALTDDDHVDASLIEVTVVKGEVTLSGSVTDRQMKRLAEDTAERVAGVNDVLNQLKIGTGRTTGMGNASELGSSENKHRA